MKRKLTWFILNAIEVALPVLAIFYAQVWAGRLATFWELIQLLIAIVSASLIGLIVLIVSLNNKLPDKSEKQKEATQKLNEGKAKMFEYIRNPSVSKSLNLLVDLGILALFIGAGWWFTGTCKLLSMILHGIVTFDPNKVKESQKQI